MPVVLVTKLRASMPIFIRELSVYRCMERPCHYSGTRSEPALPSAKLISAKMRPLRLNSEEISICYIWATTQWQDEWNVRLFHLQTPRTVLRQCGCRRPVRCLVSAIFRSCRRDRHACAHYGGATLSGWTKAIPGKVRSGFPSGIAYKQGDRAVRRFRETQSRSSDALQLSRLLDKLDSEFCWRSMAKG